jgi:phosphate transport system permease protein
MTALTLLIIAIVSIIAFFIASSKAGGLRAATGIALHSMPAYHGLATASAALVGAGLFASIAAWFLYGSGQSGYWVPAVAVVGALIAGFPVFSRITKDFRARNGFESFVKIVLILCSAVAVLTTVGIVFSVAFEALVFFREISIFEFLFTDHWAPTSTPPSFGFLPLLKGTLLITFIAILVAGPIGLFSAIYMAEYSSRPMRNILKPILEMLAGVPTVVLGFFAALTVAPLIRGSGEYFGLTVASESALAAGLVMGMMIVPLISSLSDDIINSVPQSLRDGSYAMGATKSETIRKVVLPAALPGIVSAFMLAISRAIGETMIVVMAAGLSANFSWNPLAAATTITVQIATLLVGDQEFDSAKTLSAFALGLVLFCITLALNFIAMRIVQKYREQYD